MREIEYDGKTFTQGEFEEYLANNLEEKYLSTVKTLLSGIESTKDFIAKCQDPELVEGARQNLDGTLRTLVLLAAIKPIIKPLADAIAKELEALR